MSEAKQIILESVNYRPNTDFPNLSTTRIYSVSKLASNFVIHLFMQFCIYTKLYEGYNELIHLLLCD